MRPEGRGMTTAQVRTSERQPRITLISSRLSAKPRATAWVFYTVLVAAVFFGLIYAQTELDASAFELRDLEDQIAAAEQEQLELELDLARLSSPARIVPAANDLGMVLPTQMHTLTAPGIVAKADDQDLSDPLVTASP